MTRIFVAGFGAVSPAGWGAGPMFAALKKGDPLPTAPLARPGPGLPLRVRQVPPPAERPGFLSHPRLRRSSPITHYAASACLEALDGWQKKAPENRRRLGLVACLQTGCVQYSCRFYDETLKNPATASPLVFPETVYSAPASHVAALLGGVHLAYSVVGDASAWLPALALGARWLAENRVDACLVFGAEETNWVVADALGLLDRGAVAAAGAGAVCLCREKECSAGIELAVMTDAHVITDRTDRRRAALAMRGQLGSPAAGEWLCDGLGSNPRFDVAERGAWGDWSGPRLSLKRILGEGLTAGAAWQCVAACAALVGNECPAATVSIVGAHQQAVAARLVRADFDLLAASAGGSIRP